MLVGVDAVAAFQLELEHPHEVIEMLGREVDQRLPLGRPVLEDPTADPLAG
jgi:hypothetical protein